MLSVPRWGPRSSRSSRSRIVKPPGGGSGIGIMRSGAMAMGPRLSGSAGSVRGMSEPVLAVRGEAVREVDPEIATFSVAVSARDRDRQTTLRRLTARVEAVRAVLDGYAEVIEKRETSGLYVHPETKRAGERISAYSGTVATSVTVADFTQLGELLLRLADLDQTTVAGPWWGLRPGSPVHGDARRAAIADAIWSPSGRRSWRPSRRGSGSVNRPRSRSRRPRCRPRSRSSHGTAPATGAAPAEVSRSRAGPR